MSIWRYLIFSCDDSEILHCWEGYHSDDVPFSVLHMKGHMSVCIIGDANLDHLVKVVSARILQLELFFFSS